MTCVSDLLSVASASASAARRKPKGLDPAVAAIWEGLESDEEEDFI